MDNNFDENKTEGVSDIRDTGNVQNAAPYDVQPAEYAPYPENTPKPPKKRYMSGGCFWSMIAAIAVLFAIVVLLVVLIARMSARADEDIPDYSGLFAQEAEHVVIELPVAEKPVLEEAFYQDEETGLLTAVGVAKVILPSQVQVKTFDEMPYSPISTGSGVVLTADGYILTNAHVVDGGVSFSAVFYDGTESEAVVVGMDKKSDLAVIKVDRDDLTPAQIGKSSSLVIGEEVAIAGAGGGFKNTVTYGHVTGLEREINTDYISSSTILCIQSDAALNPGNSGGALVNMYGQVVGVAVALMDHERYENMGFSIAIDDAIPIAEDLIAQGYVSSRTRVGISYTTIGDAAASEYGIMSGLCVMEIDPTCNVGSAGLQPYDIITHMDGVRVTSTEQVSEILAGKVPGDVLEATIFRKPVAAEGYVFTVDIVLEADTSSISGYSVNSSADEDDPSNRDIIK